ncbi:putative vinorine synthase [Helianthus annuus]|nr:putative vinorine synthase [Helianthus annuus]
MEINENVSKFVKPFTPTSSTLRKYTISFFDDIQPNMNVPLILYYSTPYKEQNDVQTNIFNHLEISLSKTLVEFYPLAGRYMGHGSFIDCSDQGALYIQAKAKFQLSEFLDLASELKLGMLHDFLPCEPGKPSEVDDPLLSVKLTTFECGGVAIGMCISHKFADMATFCTFVDNWATKSRKIGKDESNSKKYSPLFSSTHYLPTLNLLNDEVVVDSYEVMNNCALRVFSFKGSTITKLREKIMSKDNINIVTHRPSKVQLIVALLWEALVDMDKANGKSKASFVMQAVNLRDKIVPMAPDNFCGNFITYANVRIELSESDKIDLQVLVKLLHDSTNKIRSNYAKALTHVVEKDYDVLSRPILEMCQSITDPDVTCYAFSSWCKFSFYTADFGWGKPVWRSTTRVGFPNRVVMMDDEEGDGVDAWVQLDRKQMCELEKDPNIQAYKV